MPKAHQDYASDAIERMSALGLFKKEFLPAIKRYADYREQYDTLTGRWKREKYRCYVKAGDGTPSKRNPTCIAIESLRKDITVLETILGLTPQGLLKADENAFRGGKQKSRLSSMLQGLDEK